MNIIRSKLLRKPPLSHLTNRLILLNASVYISRMPSLASMTTAIKHFLRRILPANIRMSNQFNQFMILPSIPCGHTEFPVISIFAQTQSHATRWLHQLHQTLAIRRNNYTFSHATWHSCTAIFCQLPNRLIDNSFYLFQLLCNSLRFII